MREVRGWPACNPFDKHNDIFASNGGDRPLPPLADQRIADLAFSIPRLPLTLYVSRYEVLSDGGECGLILT